MADIGGRGSALVAFSGGVDSGLVAALAYRVVGARALAVTAAAETLAGEGFQVVHDGGAARVEVGSEEVTRLASLWDEIEPRLLSLGFQRAAYDPRGYRRGGADLPA